jgi:hypothetical protein
LGLVDASSADGCLKTLESLLRNLDVVDFEARAFEVGGEAHTHLPAGAEQGDPGHLSASLALRGQQAARHDRPPSTGKLTPLM